MKYTSLCLILLSICLKAQSQNLVVNPSFEEFVICPDQLGQIQFADGCQSFRLTPDYYNECQDNGIAGIPENELTLNTYAHDGQAYSGFAQISMPAEFSECIGIELTENLTIGETYYISFFVSRGSPVSSNCWTDKVGARFSTIAYSDWPLDVTMPIFNEAHIEYEGLIESTETWTMVSGYFTADSSYAFLSIGNQFDADSLNIVCDDEYFNYQVYYFLDAVCVSTNPDDCDIFLKTNDILAKENMFLFPNPASDFVLLKSGSTNKIEEVSLFDLQGRLISVYKNDNKSESFQIDLPNSLSKGIYLLHGKLDNNLIFYEKILIQN